MHRGLGIYVDNKLNFDEHVSQLCTKLVSMSMFHLD